MSRSSFSLVGHCGNMTSGEKGQLEGVFFTVRCLLVLHLDVSLSFYRREKKHISFFPVSAEILKRHMWLKQDRKLLIASMMKRHRHLRVSKKQRHNSADAHQKEEEEARDTHTNTCGDRREPERRKRRRREEEGGDTAWREQEEVET